MDHHVLCLNSGSSSLKFVLYKQRELDHVLMQGSAEKIGQEQSSLRIEINGQSYFHRKLPLPTAESAITELMTALNSAELPEPTACVHRIVHGGPKLTKPTLVTEEVKQELEALVALAPLHIPSELSVLQATVQAYPGIPQIVCFDTFFHQRMPEVAKRLPLPRSFGDDGIHRYGFHGLSYESIVSQLGKDVPRRTIIAHLGNGCSMVALKDSVPQDTTMGLTPTGGLMMGTRSGDLDPGVLFYLLRKSADPTQNAIARTEIILNDQSGLFGVSGISRNMEDLLELESDSIPAKEAIELFCYCAKKAVGSLYAILGGLDALVFTGGMGENSAVIRARICEELKFLNIGIDARRNDANASVISHERSSCQVRVLHTNENRIMAEHAFNLLSNTSSRTKGVA